MKKLISVLTLSLTILSLSLINSSINSSILPSNNSIVKVMASNYSISTNTYTNTIQDENGDQYNIFSYDNLTDQWLTVYTSNNSINGYDILTD